MRLIDADALEKKLHELALDEWNQGVSTSWSNVYLECEDMVYDAPTVDAVEVVRCKDCRFSHMTYSGECKSCDKWVDDDDFHLTLYLDGDFYCAWGERREDETN